MPNYKCDHKTVEIMDGIHGTISAVYGAHYKPYTMSHFPRFKVAWRYARTLMDLTGKEMIIFKPIKGNYGGFYFNHNQRIYIDPRRTFKAVVTTLMHELVHAEQYKQGRLKSSGGAFFWNGQLQVPVDPSVSVEAYKNLPWEKEAYGRQDELTQKVLKVCK